MTTVWNCSEKWQLEFFRAQHGDDQVDEAGERDQADNDVFHGEKSSRYGGPRRLPHLLAEVGVGDGEGEERHRDSDEDKVVQVHARTILATGDFA